MTHEQRWKTFLAQKMHRIVEFLTSQGITMAGNLFYGFLCVRLLPIPEYAKFVVVFAIQGSLVVFMDAGFSGSLAPLIGERIEDRQLIADYVASLRQIAHWLYALIAVAAIFVYPALVRNRHWSVPVVAAMIGILLVSTWFARVGANYGSVLLLRRDRRRWYRHQMASSLGTLALLGVFLAFHWLNGFSAILINVAGIIGVALANYRRAGQLLGVVGVASKEKRTAIIHLTLPSMSSVLFYALQGPLSVVLIAMFGRTAGVASVGALGRLGQVFGVFGPMNAVLLEPYFASLPKRHLKANYLAAVTITAVCGLTVIAMARVFPELFLWILGAKYKDLRSELVLQMISSAIGLLGGVIATVNVSRRFVYHPLIISDNIITLVVQAVFIWKVDLSTVAAVLFFNIATQLPSLCTGVIAAFYGFAYGGRRIVGIKCDAEAG